jgi:uncharacterized protein
MRYPQVYIDVVAGKGRGVFTRRAILEGTIVETAHVIVMSETDRTLIDQTLLHDYIFEWQPNGANMCCMALGNIPLYNHSYSANCEHAMDYSNGTMLITAVRNIAAGEELTINYNGDWNNAEPVWFETAAKEEAP